MDEICRDMEYSPIYAIGTANFENIRTSGCVYVDKTEYIWKMIHTKAPVFLSRPRRFGKSLLTDTIACYFSGRKELFDGLKIAEYEKEWKEYPVLKFDLSRAKEGESMPIIFEGLHEQLAYYEQQWNAPAGKLSAGDRLVAIIRSAKARTGQNVVVLVDEYDAPLNNNIDKPEEFQSAIRSELRSFFGPIKSCEADIRFAFLTGITRYSQLGIFSELNTLDNISMQAEYAGICGITQEELHTTLYRDVELLAQKLGKSLEETYDKLKMQYDGYHFCDKSPDVYSPFSLFKCLHYCKIDNFWFGSATPTMLVKYLRKMNFSFDLSELDGMLMRESSFDVPVETAEDAIPLLYQSGYLTIKGYDEPLSSYIIGVPNNDVRIGLSENLLPLISSYTKTQNNTFMIRFQQAILSDDTTAAKELLHAYLAGLPCDILKDKGEHTYHAIFYALFSLLGFPPKIENGTARGYSDMIFQTATSIYCMEFKVDQSAEKAIRQIIEKGYLEPYTTTGKRLVMIGVNFSTKERNITEWVEQAFDH